MAIPEFPRDVAGFPLRALSPGTTEELAIASASEVISAAINSTIMRIASTVDITFAIAADPTGSAVNAAFLPGNTVEYFALNSGDKVAAVSETGKATGRLYITLLT